MNSFADLPLAKVEELYRTRLTQQQREQIACRISSHDWKLVKADKQKATYKCSKCEVQITFLPPGEVTQGAERQASSDH
jgi:hypothetical protein